ncbi:MAG: J domain-containing protein, partial [Wenzhouxiangella sp.]
MSVLDVQALAEQVRTGQVERFSLAEVDAILAWVAGSRRLGGAELLEQLGTPTERPDLLLQVYAWLDDQVFTNQRLNLDAAGLDGGRADDERKARFRRLMAAFHPDRFPAHERWLTPRSQAIHTAYSRFRRGDDPEPLEPEAAQAKRPAAPVSPIRTRRSARITPGSSDLGLRLVQRLRRIDNLAPKSLVALAVLAFVPVIWMYFAYQPYRGHPESTMTGQLDPRPPELAGDPSGLDRQPPQVVESDTTAPEPESPIAAEETSPVALSFDPLPETTPTLQQALAGVGTTRPSRAERRSEVPASRPQPEAEPETEPEPAPEPVPAPPGPVVAMAPPPAPPIVADDSPAQAGSIQERSTRQRPTQERVTEGALTRDASTEDPRSPESPLRPPPPEPAPEPIPE